MQALLDASGDEVEFEGNQLRLTHWRLFDGSLPVHAATFEIWNAVWEGLLSVYNRFLKLSGKIQYDATFNAVIDWEIS